MTSSGQVHDLDSKGLNVIRSRTWSGSLKELNVIRLRTWSGIGHKPKEHSRFFNMVAFLTLITFN